MGWGWVRGLERGWGWVKTNLKARAVIKKQKKKKKKKNLLQA